MKKFNGRISISRYSSNKAPFHGIQIDVQDDTSAQMVLRMDISIEEFGNAITGLGYRPCECELPANFERIGKKLEVKTIEVDITEIKDSWNMSSDEWQEALTIVTNSHVKDGWQPSLDDRPNFHRRTQKNGRTMYRVDFFRYVDSDGGVE
jgi:hypothetical protein